MEETKFIYRLRLLLGVILGLICGLLRIKGLSGLYLAVILYVITHFVFKKILKRLPEKSYMIGLMEYFALWLTLWSIVYTFLST